MDQFIRKQQEIDQRAAEVSAAYSTLWSRMIANWRQPGSEDQALLRYSANYLFRTALQNVPPLLEAFCQFCRDLRPLRVVLIHLEEFGRDANDY